jgi:hypothetical protein
MFSSKDLLLATNEKNKSYSYIRMYYMYIMLKAIETISDAVVY